MSKLEIPDELGVVVAARAWRAYRVTQTDRILKAAAYDTKWPRHRPVKAACRASQGFFAMYMGFGEAAPRHSAPDPECGCGLWGLADPLLLPREEYKGPLVFGVVHLWGLIIPGEDGWRGEYARPVALVQRDRRRVRGLEWETSRSYGIPVLNEWPDLTPPRPPEPKEAKHGHRKDRPAIPNRTHTGGTTHSGGIPYTFRTFSIDPGTGTGSGTSVTS